MSADEPATYDELHAEIRRLRALVAEILGEFDHTAADNWCAHVIGVDYDIWRRRAGLDARP